MTEFHALLFGPFLFPKLQSEVDNMTAEQFLQDKQVAAMLGICRASVWVLAKAGHLTPFKLTGRCTRFKMSQVLEFAEKGRR